jgi:hypothetical protein
MYVNGGGREKEGMKKRWRMEKRNRGGERREKEVKIMSRRKGE